LAIARADGKVEGGPFWIVPGGAVLVRDRSAVSSTSLRQPDYIPTMEFDEAIRLTVTRSVAIAVDEIARGVAEALGFGSTTGSLKAAVLERIGVLTAEGVLIEVEGLLRLQAVDAGQ
jgi:hypothetical protein